MNRWLQTKRYQCPSCGAIYLHDRAHHHAVFECPNRPTMVTRRLVLVMKVYEPKAGR
jgi:predicted RNA-binding Zn-ribbon protein involved in translation (DUF1610 family)